MCEPVTIAAATLAMAAVSTYVMYSEGNKSADRQAKVVQEGLAQDRNNTKAIYEQINQSSMDDQAQRHTEYLIDAARLHAVHDESGMQGASFDRQSQEVANNAASDMASIEKNRNWKGANAASQSQAAGTQASVQLAGRGPACGPDLYHLPRSNFQALAFRQLA